MADPADARRRAEEWLTRYDGAVPSIPPGSADPPEVRLLRALLAAWPEAPPPPSDAVREAKAARPKGDIWDACGCPNPDDCEHVFYAPAPSDAVREAAEAVVRDDWWGHYCPCCGATVNHGPECLIGRLAEALSSARAAKGGGER